MKRDLTGEIEALRGMTVRELRLRYADIFQEETRAGNKQWLLKRIAWRMQALAEGDLSQRARQRAEELANDADVRVTPPKSNPLAVQPLQIVDLPAADSRLPGSGSVLTRKYKGRLLRVIVLADGFEYEGEHFASLSAVAKAITGSHCNGFRFFNLEARA